MSESYATLGEAFIERELETENRAGVEHYKLGQHKAVLQGEPEDFAVAQLSWCSSLGVTVAVAAKQMPDGEWELAVPTCRVVGLSFDYGMKPMPADFEFTDEMKAALAEVDGQL